MTDPREGDIVRYKSGIDVYKVIEKSCKLWLKKVDNGNRHSIPHKSMLVLVSRPIKYRNTSDFAAIDRLSGSENATDAMSYALNMAGIEKNILNRVTNKENKMSIQINSLVAKVTDNIKDAQLVTQYFGYELNEGSIKDEFFVRDNYEELLNEAKARQEKADALVEKVRAS